MPFMPQSSEAALLARLQTLLGPERTLHPALPGPVWGDDAALFAADWLAPGHTPVITQDLLMEDIDFRRDWSTLEEAGLKAAQVNLSDLAAKGAEGRWAFVAVAVPGATAAADLEALYSGLRAGFAGTQVIIAGGDLSASPGPVAIDLTLIGEVPAGQAWRRTGLIEPGWVCWLSRPVGWARLGLLACERGWRHDPDPMLQQSLRAFLTPVAETAVSHQLRAAGYHGLCMDVSDGLLRDVPRLLGTNTCGLLIEAAALPLNQAFQETASRLKVNPQETALTGGEDLALLGLCSPEHWRSLQAVFTGEMNLFPIGRATAEPGIALQMPAGTVHPWPTGGFDHFAGDLR